MIIRSQRYPATATLPLRIFADAEKAVRLSEITAGLILVFALLLLTSLAFPPEGIRISSRLTLTFPSVKEALGLTDYSGFETSFSIDCSEEGFSNFAGDPNRFEKSSLPLKCTPEQIRALPVQPIEYPQDRKDALNGIMSKLAALRAGNRELVRILHYGDSQLEADRMTMYLRNQLQREFGGGGVGYVALSPQIPINPTVKISMSDNWGYSIPAVKYKHPSPLRVGHMLSSVSLPLKQQKTAWIKVERRPIKAYPSLRFSRIKLLVANSFAPIYLEVKTPTKTIFSNIIPSNMDMQELNLSMQGSHESVTLHFRGSGCPEIYGLALDFNSGVAVDNIPLRSSSGIDFVKADVQLLAKSYSLIDAKFVIMQFGANVVPQIMKSYSYYEEQLYRQLTLIKQMIPDVSILVVGVSDMARRSNGVLASYPNIAKIRNAQRQAAFRAGCAFWDTYEAMGGKNSIISWAYASPVLATKDFCHFSNNGATLVTELLYRSFSRDFKRYLATNGKAHATPLAENSPSQ
ncbi:MAG: hypothetical protein LBH84_01490 [Prevotellaceae bacterium]|jgi:hypothetical protein|nr:hypothetical protein [Prevotellaceae bacterium]